MSLSPKGEKLFHPVPLEAITKRDDDGHNGSAEKGDPQCRKDRRQVRPDDRKNLKHFGAKQQNDRDQKVSGILFRIVFDRCNATENEKQRGHYGSRDKGGRDREDDGERSCCRSNHIHVSLQIIVETKPYRG